MKLSKLKSWHRISQPTQSMLIQFANDLGGLRAAISHFCDRCDNGECPTDISDLKTLIDLYAEIEEQIADIADQERNKCVCVRCQKWTRKSQLCAHYNFRIMSGAIRGCLEYHPYDV